MVIPRAPSGRASLPCCLALGLILFACFPTSAAPTELYTINYSKTLDPRDLAAYDFCIISPYADIDLVEARRRGGRFYAYLSVGEIAPDAPYRTNALARKIPLVDRNETWQSDLVDLAHPAWSEFMSELGRNAVRNGFDGFFLDTMDALETLSQKNPAQAAAYKKGLIQLIKRLRSDHPGRPIIVNRGFDILPQLTNVVDGLLVESLFQTYDATAKKYVAVGENTTKELLSRIEKFRGNLPVYIVDYVDPQQRELARATAEKISRLGYSPLITTIDLQGPPLAPLVPKPRSLLNIFGNQALEVENRIKWPADSFAARAAQMPLEWLGYELDYLNIVTDDPPADLSHRYCGILIDRFVEIPTDKEGPLADWLLKHHGRGLKIVWLGEIPFEQEEHREKLFRAFGIQGHGNIVSQLERVQLRSKSESLMDFETKVHLLVNGFRELAAPTNAAVHFSLSAQSRRGTSHRYDAVFTTAWGGCALDPYITFQRPDFCELWLIDPFRFFSAALGSDASPVPDPSTRDGLRVFYTHIDGDGFGNRSVVEPGKRSAEIIRDRILKVYPYPVTCSVIESEIRGRLVGQDPGDEQLLTAIARSIFALPNVQAGSHTYTHPFFWIDNDRTALNYEGQNLELVAPFDREALDLKREILGSVSYINRALLPAGREVSVFLWSGNCRPGPAALALIKELGIESLNGGETLVSGRYPTLTAVAPRVMPWQNELQIYASNQNENEFNENWVGPSYGGFIHTIEVFKRTETPRRLKPMNIYYHMYSGDYFDSLHVLDMVHQFVHTQQVHAVTAAQFAGIARDSHDTRVHRLSDDHWILTNQGKLTTFRVPLRGRFPDLSRSKGVTGFKEGAGVLYLHTDGSPKVTLVLTDQPPHRPYLIASSAEIKFEQLSPAGVDFSTVDSRPVSVDLGGLARNAVLVVLVNDETRSVQTDERGRLSLQLPAKGKVLIPHPEKTGS